MLEVFQVDRSVLTFPHALMFTVMEPPPLLLMALCGSPTAAEKVSCPDRDPFQHRPLPLTIPSVIGRTASGTLSPVAGGVCLSRGPLAITFQECPPCSASGAVVSDAA